MNLDETYENLISLFLDGKHKVDANPRNDPSKHMGSIFENLRYLMDKNSLEDLVDLCIGAAIMYYMLRFMSVEDYEKVLRQIPKEKFIYMFQHIDKINDLKGGIVPMSSEDTAKHGELLRKLVEINKEIQETHDSISMHHLIEERDAIKQRIDDFLKNKIKEE